MIRSVEGMLHTPGPWSCEKIWDIPETRVHANVEGRDVALAGCFTMRAAGQREANARLIAAAPELLVVLRIFVDWQAETKHAIPLVWLERARSAISKAEGRL